MKTKRPVGVSIFSIIQFIIGIASLIIIIQEFLKVESFSLGIKDILIAIILTLMFILAICYFYSSIALFFLHKSGRETILIFAYLAIFRTILAVFTELSNILFFIPAIIYAVITIWYFNKPEIKKIFNKK